jgi:hypothetical protein
MKFRDLIEDDLDEGRRIVPGKSGMDATAQLAAVLIAMQKELPSGYFNPDQDWYDEKKEAAYTKNVDAFKKKLEKLQTALPAAIKGVE